MVYIAVVIRSKNEQTTEECFEKINDNTTINQHTNITNKIITTMTITMTLGSLIFYQTK